MKRAAITFLAAGFSLGCLRAQAPSPDEYRDTYRAWREADPKLEKDAAQLTAELSARGASAAALAAKYDAARQIFLKSLLDQVNQRISDLESGAAPLDVPPSVTSTVQDYLAMENGILQRSITAFANDPDRGIQQLKQSLERERAALDAITPAIADRQKSFDAASQAAEAAQQALLKVLDQYQDLASGAKQASAQMEQETPLWSSYYQALASGSRPSSAQLAEAANTSPAARPDMGGVRVQSPAERPATVTPVPLARYVGAWVFPALNGLFHGPQPDFVDLVVREDGGHATGTLFARFKIPPGTAGDPEIRFDFSGDFGPTRMQRMTIETSDGATGTIELIPGPAFNLLEVNFQTNGPAGKIRQGNFVLLKK